MIVIVRRNLSLESSTRVENIRLIKRNYPEDRCRIRIVYFVLFMSYDFQCKSQIMTPGGSSNELKWPYTGDKWRVHHLGEKGQVCSGSDSWRFATYSLSFQLCLKVEYKTHDGKKKKSKLLTSGFWGLARHLNYVFELLLALSWRWQNNI